MMKVYAVIILCLLGICGCSGGGGGPVKVNSSAEKNLVSIKVTPADNVLAVGLQKQFTAMGVYSDTTEEDLTALVTWSSSDASVAAISNGPDSKGMVTVLGRSAQPIVITARLDTVSGWTNLAVPPKELVTIAVTPVNSTMAIGTTHNFKATGTYSDGSSSDITGAVQWSSSLPSVATAASLGKVTGVAAGSTTLTATLGAMTGSTNLTVTSASLLSISITPVNPTLAVGNIRQFAATGHFSDNSSQDLTSTVTWKSSVPSVAAISAEGMVTTGVAGTTTISAVYRNIPNDISVDSVLTVIEVTLQSIAITPSIADLAAGSTRQLAATGTYSDGSTQDVSKSVTWVSSDSSIASVKDGIFVADKVGSATITASFAGVSASAVSTIKPANLSGTWVGTYTIYDDPKDPSQIGTYNLSLVLSQSGNTLSGTTTLRGSRPDTAVSNQLSGNVWDRRVDFQFTYFSPFLSTLMDNLGKMEITDSTLTGSAVENYSAGYNCSYVFSLTKQP